MGEGPFPGSAPSFYMPLPFSPASKKPVFSDLNLNIVRNPKLSVCDRQAASDPKTSTPVTITKLPFPLSLARVKMLEKWQNLNAQMLKRVTRNEELRVKNSKRVGEG